MDATLLANAVAPSPDGGDAGGWGTIGGVPGEAQGAEDPAGGGHSAGLRAERGPRGPAGGAASALAAGGGLIPEVGPEGWSQGC